MTKKKRSSKMTPFNKQINTDVVRGRFSDVSVFKGNNKVAGVAIITPHTGEGYPPRALVADKKGIKSTTKEQGIKKLTSSGLSKATIRKMHL